MQSCITYITISCLKSSCGDLSVQFPTQDNFQLEFRLSEEHMQTLDHLHCGQAPQKVAWDPVHVL